jgi:hypothetical protein
MQTSTKTSIHKVRRDALGGKRGDGHLHLGEKIRRPDPGRIHVAGGDPTLTGCGGLATFGTFLREQDIDRELARRFTRLKSGSLVVYPMAAQRLGASVVTATANQFGYRDLKRAVTDTLASATRALGGEVPTSFERDVRVAGERRVFWSRFCELPPIAVDTAAIARDWRVLREAVTAALTAKQGAPLERLSLPPEARAAAASYAAHREQIAALSQQLQAANRTILLVKEQAAAGNAAALAADIARFKVIKARQTPAMIAACAAYAAAKAEKAQTEDTRKTAKEALDQYRTGAFPGFQTTINDYLQRFNAGFRLDQVTAANTRGGPSCTYNVMINNVAVPVAGADAPGRPGFRNTLSAGDRNTLALAFFFASLEADPNLGQKIVVIDDLSPASTSTARSRRCRRSDASRSARPRSS